MRLDASAYKMCVATFPSPLNRTARSRRAGPRARRLPDQLAWETLSRSAREGGEQLPKIGLAEPKFSPISEPWLSLKTVCSDLAFPASTLLVCKGFSGVILIKHLKSRTNNG